MSEPFGESVGFVGAAMHQHETLTGACQRCQVVSEWVIGDASAAADFDNDHAEASFGR